MKLHICHNYILCTSIDKGNKIPTYARLYCGQTSQRACDGYREESAGGGGEKPHSQTSSYLMQPENT